MMVIDLDDNTWSEPVVPPAPDPEVERGIKKLLGFVPKPVAYVLPCRWVVDGACDFHRVAPRHLTPRQAELCAFVTSQENACRYCYGSSRALLRLMGMSETAVGAVERDMQLAELSPADRALLDFCRRLAQSNPRPARPQYERLVESGVSPEVVREAAVTVACTCVNNRVATFLAVPPESDLEAMPDRILTRLLRPVLMWMMQRMMQPLAPDEGIDAYDGPYARVLEALGDLPQGRNIGHVLDRMFTTSLLGRRTCLLVFAIVARGLGCPVCEDEARTHLLAEGLSHADVEQAVTLLDAAVLTDAERAIIEFARNTVRYRPRVIQDHARQLHAAVGRELLIEAVGVSAMANCIVRLGMLLQCR